MNSVAIVVAFVAGTFVACSGSSKSEVGGGDDGGAGDGVVVTTPSSAAGSAEAGACAPEVASFDGSWVEGTSGPTTYYRFDNAAPKALLVALHGTNGSSVGVARTKLEWHSLFSAARAKGFSVLVPESQLRDKPRQWDNTPSRDNPDILRIASLIDEARTNGRLPATVPIYVVGMSQGGGVAPIFGQLLADSGYPVRAVGAYCAGGTAVYDRAEYRLPTFFAAMAADDVVAHSAASSKTSAAALTARGIAAEIRVKPVEKLCSGRLTRIAGIDAAAARAIFDSLVAAGMVAADGTVISTGSDLDQTSVLVGVPEAYADFTRAIDEQLQVVAATHAFHGDNNDALLTFFAARP